ncbi:hypothetical protein AB0H58_02360 [Nocardia neocaledoniensis]|nr:hypothetical protein [Nocardia neocaledoniensis]
MNWLTFADRATAAEQADILVDLLGTFLSAQAATRVPARGVRLRE